MSLISDALKKAQAQWGQRTAKTARSSPASILPPLHSWPGTLRLRRRAMVLGSAIGVPLVVALLLLWNADRGHQLASSRGTLPSPASAPPAGAGSPPHEPEREQTRPAEPASTNPRPVVTAQPADSAVLAPSTDPTHESGKMVGGSTEPLSKTGVVGQKRQPGRKATPRKVGKVARSPEDIKREAVSLFKTGVAYQKSSLHSKAIEAYQKAIRLDPSNVSAYNNLAILHKQQGNFAKAIETYQLALAQDPTYSDTRSNLGAAYLTAGRPEDAARELSVVLMEDPKNVAARVNLGLTFKRLGRNEEAEHAFKKALALSPNFPEAHHSLATLLEEKGAIRAAIRHFQRYLELAQESSPDVKEAVRQHLAGLQRSITDP